MICQKPDLTVASGCALADIPMIILSKKEFDSMENGKELKIDTESEKILT